MITINGINIDTIGQATNELSKEWAVFTVEFEYDNKIIVCHAFSESVYRSIKRIIARVLADKAGNLELRRAFLQSKFLTVSVIYEFQDYSAKYSDIALNDKKDLILDVKYDYIKRNHSYYPYGYNILTDIVNIKRQEWLHASRLYNELLTKIDAEALYVPEELKLMSRGRPGKSVHKFNAHTGLYMETYNSLKDAAMANNVSSSNISACCNDKAGKKTTGGFKWSYDKDTIFLN